MDSISSLVTGATGLLGSHIAERLVGRGRRVRALVRAGSDAAFLESLGVEIVRGDLTDPAACTAAVRGVDVLYHCAAKVGDWGAWPEFQAGCLDATRNLATAALDANVGRFVHVSSTSAYGHPKEGGPAVDESAPLGQGLWPIWDYYTISKVETERLLWRLVGERGLRLTVIRPSWLYGERDRTTAHRLIGKFRRGAVPLIGRGGNPISAIYAGDVAEAAILAADDPGSAGEAYNVTDQGPINQRDYLNLWAAACGGPPIRRFHRYRIVFAAATLLEAAYRLARSPRPPIITRYATWLLGRDLAYSTAKARGRLGWSPAEGYRERIGRTVRWFDDRQGEIPAPVPGGAD